MKRVQRFDTVKVKARFDENGFLVDTPIVARIGAQTYQTPNGPRVEFRPRSEVFDAESLASYQGKPITLGHKMVNAKNAKGLVVGSCSGAGKEDGIGVLVPVMIYDGESIEQAKKRVAAELSVGYTSIDIDKKGWGNNATGEYYFDEDLPENFEELKNDSVSDWVRFDAVQTKIRVNHVALVFRGRAGIAKLNLDSEQEFPYDDDSNHKGAKTMIIKIDGVDVEVADNVGAHIAKLDAQIATATSQVTSITAERDALQTKVDGIEDEVAARVAKIKADEDAKQKVVAIVSAAGIKCDDLDVKAMKVAYIKEADGRDLSDKEDSYIDASFDFISNSDKMASNRSKVFAKKEDGEQEDKKGAPKLDGSNIIDPQAKFRN